MVYTSSIGDSKSDGEEFGCAVFLDEHPNVGFWMRNVDRKPNAFWFQLSGGQFYPDFVAMLNHGRTLAMEYKGQHLADGAPEKRLVGELWAEASNGQCIFAMLVGGDFSAIEQAISLISTKTGWRVWPIGDCNALARWRVGYTLCSWETSSCSW